MKLFRYGFLIFVFIASLAATTAQPSETPPPIAGMLDALGGREAIGELRGLAVEADCSGPGGAFRTRVESFLPASTYFEQSSGEGTTRIWSTEGQTWRLREDGALEDLSAAVRAFVRGHEFHLLLLEIDARFTNHRAAGDSEADGKPCRLVRMEASDTGEPASICISPADDLPLYLEMNPAGAEGPVRVTFEDWRELDGLRYFFAFTLTEGPERTFTYDYRLIEPDGVAADRFVAPAPEGRKADQEALLGLLRSARLAHLETDAGRIASNVADSLIEVSAGRVERVSRDDVAALFTRVFEGARYHMWEDTVPPLIRISADGSMAWVVRSVRVSRDAPGPDGKLQPQEFTSAYTATYAKQDGRWRMTSVTSTFLPG